jgi:hypothetical protein
MTPITPDPGIISWSDVQARANRFAAEWKDETRERANKDTFWDEFFQVFGIRRRSVAVYEEHAKRASTGGGGFMDVFWPGVIAVEHKSAGEDLEAAMAQAMDYLPGLRPEHHPRLVVVSDFARMVVRDLDADTKVEFPLADLAAHVQLFAVLTGRRRRRVSEGDEVEVNLTATFLLRNLHDALKASGYDSHPLRVLMVRVLFALFADDTEVWEQDLFHSWLLEQTREDGSDLGSALSHLWQVLNTAPKLRSTNLEETLRAFAYINGGLFKETLPIPDFTRDMRESLIECCLFDWSAISPAIFGSLFQEVMTPLARRQIGAHYTTEQNILRTIEPLFLAELRRELDAATTRPALVRFRSRLASLTFFDPACGCGNFLVIAYREIRKIETECLRRLRARDKANARQDVLDVTVDSQVRVGQFYGIEIEEFPVRIAETAMYLMDHLENRALGREFGGYHVRFPIADTAHIHLGNALRIDWHQVLPARECSYLFGNPPFVGKKARSSEQQADMDLVFHGRRGAGTLDYVTAWYDKAAAYIAGTDTLVAFVSTNSIVQGEQVPILWPPLLADGLEIGFAHRTFAWTSEARGKASVHCVIIGFASRTWPTQRQIFDYATPKSDPQVRRAKEINAYLIDAPPVIVTRRRVPLCNVPPASFGSMPNDDGAFLFTEDEAASVRRTDPIAAVYLREIASARQLLHGERRWCLWLVAAHAEDIRRSPILLERVERVRAYRSRSKRPTTKALADTPYLFGEMRQPTSDYLCVPRHVGETRRLVPMRFFPPTMVASDSTIAIPGADLYLFGVLQSATFTAWVRTVGGRIKNDLRMSVEQVYNTFPFPEPDTAHRQRVAKAAEAVIEAREAHPGVALGDLYDPLATPADVMKAHRDLDQAVASCYGARRPKTDADYLAILFDRYAMLTGGDRLFKD